MFMTYEFEYLLVIFCEFFTDEFPTYLPILDFKDEFSTQLPIVDFTDEISTHLPILDVGFKQWCLNDIV